MSSAASLGPGPAACAGASAASSASTLVRALSTRAGQTQMGGDGGIGGVGDGGGMAIDNAAFAANFFFCLATRGVTSGSWLPFGLQMTPIFFMRLLSSLLIFMLVAIRLGKSSREIRPILDMRLRSDLSSLLIFMHVAT